MDIEIPREFDEPHNVVLRGGPLDGTTLWVNQFGVVVERRIGGVGYRYAPTGEVDEEFPTLAIFTYVGTAL